MTCLSRQGTRCIQGLADLRASRSDALQNPSLKMGPHSAICQLQQEVPRHSPHLQVASHRHEPCIAQSHSEPISAEAAQPHAGSSTVGLAA